ncbi:hypothetical protein SDC9_167430 [bioreactor metagenome]|uniref:Uncharacterized protein n=1 Tax=bioreactor metagenome TaxID=1076179 RepID=A0A645G7G6_9ZZZZ
MILFPELHRVVPLRFEVRRIAIEKGVVPVVLTDQRLEVLVFNDGFFQPVVGLPDEMEGLADIKGLAAVAGAAASVAVADDLEEGGGALDVVHDRVLQKDLTYFLELRSRQVVL